ncbi:MAG: hypothetical protein JXR88_01370 [Clostridia bacterium]|nr:hypothetical protein [Clostridia bacterium]
MKIIKLLCLSLLIFILLIGCSEKTVKPDQWNIQDYVTFEIGSNFADHMWAIASENRTYEALVYDKIDLIDYQLIVSWYDLLYTHRIDYLYPQIYYYIPVSQNFETVKAWEDYFQAWETALKEQSVDPVEIYFEGLSNESYIRDYFNETSMSLWDSLFVDQLDTLKEIDAFYVDAFKDYEKKIWPEVSQRLKGKANYVNEALSTQNLRVLWMHATKHDFNNEEIKFTLSQVFNPDFEYISLKDNQIHLYYDLKEDPYEFTEIISQRMGYLLMKQDMKDVFATITTAYAPLTEDYNLYEIVDETLEFYAAMYNKFILGFKTNAFKTLLAKNPDLAYLELFLPPQDEVTDVVSEGLVYLLDRMKDRKPYLFEDGLHYQGEVYESIPFSKGVLYFHEGNPLVYEENGHMEILYDEPTSTPVVQNQQIFFIGPYQNQVIKNLYLYSFDERTLTNLTNFNSLNQEGVFQFVWDLNQTIYYVKGFAYGQGEDGLLFKMDMETFESEIVPITIEENYRISQLYRDHDDVKISLVNEDESNIIELKVSE